MIQNLKVEKLNNRLSGEFEFHEDLNIFTGPNGSCKTTLLKLLWYLISGQLAQILAEIPFHSIAIQTELFVFSMKRVGSERVILDCRFGEDVVMDEFIVIDAETGKIAQKDADRINSLEKQVARTTERSLFFPTFRRIEGGFSIDRNTGHTEEAVVVRLLSSTTEMLQTAMSRLSEDLSTKRHKFITSVSTKDIEELLPLKKMEIANKVNELYVELSGRIGKEVASSDTNKSSRDQAISALEHIQDDLLETGKTRQKLENRMTVLDETVQIIFGREIQVAEGIILGGKKETGNKKSAIQADKLSSGEKQMLSFLSYNAFSDNTAIFIDEPELSLHQDWQDILLPLLLKQETGNQFFVATHSEFIYDQFPDNEFILRLEGN